MTHLNFRATEDRSQKERKNADLTATRGRKGIMSYVMKKDKQYVKILETGKIVEVYFKHRDGVAYVSKKRRHAVIRGRV